MSVISLMASFSQKKAQPEKQCLAQSYTTQHRGGQRARQQAKAICLQHCGGNSRRHPQEKWGSHNFPENVTELTGRNLVLERLYYYSNSAPSIPFTQAWVGLVSRLCTGLSWGAWITCEGTPIS